MFGFERSGTTLLSMMLGAHPQIAVPLSTTGLWYRYEAKPSTPDDLATSEGLERLVDSLLREERIRLWDAELEHSALLDACRPGDFGSVVAAFHSAYAARMQKPYWASMDISTLYHMEDAHVWFSDARFVHIVRDGRDVALSHETYRYGLSTLVEVAEKWRQELRCSLRMGHLLGPERYYVIRYEDLITAPEVTLQKLCNYLGVEYNAAMMDYPRMVKDKVPEDRRSLWPSLGKAPQAANAFRWREAMSQRKRVVFEQYAGDMLRMLGYDAYDKVPMNLGARALDFWCYLAAGGRFRRLRNKFNIHM
jgi:hypothetical protein